MTLIELLAAMLGGGSLVGFIVGMVTIRWQRMKARGEARQAELEATKTEQDTYQEIITDLKEHNDELRKYNGELREERSDLRKRIDQNERKIREQDEKIREQDEKQREQADEIAELKKKLELVTLMVCGNTDCALRTRYIMGLVDDKSFGDGKEAKEPASRKKGKK